MKLQSFVAFFFLHIWKVESITKIVPKDISVSLQVTPGDETSYLFQAEGRLYRRFNLEYILDGSSCSPPFAVTVEKNQTSTTQVITVMNEGLEVYELSNAFSYATIDKSGLSPQILPIDGGSRLLNASQAFTLTTKCPSKITNDNYWSPIQVQLIYNNTFMIEFAYEVSCLYSYPGTTFSWSIVVLIIISFVLMIAFAKFSKIYSFSLPLGPVNRKQVFHGFTLNFTLLFTCLIIYLVIGLLCIYFTPMMRIITIFIILIVGFIATLFFINEIFCLADPKSLMKKRVLWYFRLSDILSTTIAIVIIFGYDYSAKAWYFNDLMAICLIGSAVKIFKLKSLKEASLFLLSFAIMDLFLAFLIFYTKDTVYNILVLKYYNFPIQLMLPVFGIQFERKCTWISILGVLLPSLFIGFCYRFDKHMGGNLYTFLSFMGLMLGEMIWLVTQIHNPQNFPQSVFTYWIMLGAVAYWGKQRGDFNTLWTGSFHDSILEFEYGPVLNIQDKQNMMYNQQF